MALGLHERLHAIGRKETHHQPAQRHVPVSPCIFRKRTERESVGLAIPEPVAEDERACAVALQHLCRGRGDKIEEILLGNAIGIVLRQEALVVQELLFVLLEAEHLVETAARKHAPGAPVGLLEREVVVRDHASATLHEAADAIACRLVEHIGERQHQRAERRIEAVANHLRAHDLRRDMRIEEQPQRAGLAIKDVRRHAVHRRKHRIGMENRHLRTPLCVCETPAKRSDLCRSAATSNGARQGLAVSTAHAVGACLKVRETRPPAPVHEPFGAKSGRHGRLAHYLIVVWGHVVVVIGPVAACRLHHEERLAFARRHGRRHGKRKLHVLAGADEAARSHDVRRAPERPYVIHHAATCRRSEHFDDRRLRGAALLHQRISPLDVSGEVCRHEPGPVVPRGIAAPVSGRTAWRTHGGEVGKVHRPLRAPCLV